MKQNNAIISIFQIAKFVNQKALPSLSGTNLEKHIEQIYKAGSYDDHAHKGSCLAREVLEKLGLTDNIETELTGCALSLACNGYIVHNDIR